MNTQNFEQMNLVKTNENSRFLKKRINLDEVKRMIELYELNTSSRKREKLYYRCVLMYYLRTHLKHYSYEKVGKLFGRDHSTVLHSLRTFHELMENIIMYPDFKEILEDVNSQIFIYGDVDLTPLELRIAMTSTTSELIAIRNEILNRIN